MKPAVIQIRRDICKDCTRACEVRATINHADPCAECPFRVFHRHSDCDPDDPKQLRGLGDVVAIIANPIAKVLRIDPKKCGCHGPNGRQAWLNKAVPFTSPPPASPPTA